MTQVDVLTFGHDFAVVSRREHLLRRAGLTVLSNSGAAAAPRVIPFTTYRLLLVGHTVPPQEQHMLCELSRRHAPTVPIVVIVDSGNEAPAEASAVLVAPVVPERLVEVVNAVLQSAAAEAAAGLQA